MGDIKLQVDTHDKLRALIDTSRHQIDLFANKWGDLSNKIPRTNLIQPFDDLANHLVNVNAEVKCRKIAGLHGYEYMNESSRLGMLNFEEARNAGMTRSAQYVHPAATSYGSVQGVQGAYLSNNSQYSTQGNIAHQTLVQGSNYYGQHNYNQLGNFQVMTPGVQYVQEGNTVQGTHQVQGQIYLTPGANESIQGQVHIMNGSQNPSVQKI